MAEGRKRHPQQLSVRVAENIWVFTARLPKTRESQVVPSSVVALVHETANPALRRLVLPSQYGFGREPLAGWGRALIDMPEGKDDLLGGDKPQTVVLVAGNSGYPELFKPLKNLRDQSPWEYATEDRSIKLFRAAIRPRIFSREMVAGSAGQKPCPLVQEMLEALRLDVPVKRFSFAEQVRKLGGEQAAAFLSDLTLYLQSLTHSPAELSPVRLGTPIRRNSQ